MKIDEKQHNYKAANYTKIERRKIAEVIANK